MKIAAITDDGKTISQHFGRADYYQVITIENGQPAGTELREKLSHSHLSGQHHEPLQVGQRHGFDPASQSRHSQMAQTISDCQVLLCRGMGQGAYDSLTSQGIKVIMTDIAAIDEAVQAYLAGTLIDHPEKLH